MRIFDPELSQKSNETTSFVVLNGAHGHKHFFLVRTDLLQFHTKTMYFSCVLGILLSQKAINKLNVIQRNQSSNWKFYRKNCGSIWSQKWTKHDSKELIRTGLHYIRPVLFVFMHIGRLVPYPPSTIFVLLIDWRTVFEVTTRQRAVIFGFQENNWQVRIFKWPC